MIFRNAARALATAPLNGEKRKEVGNELRAPIEKLHFFFFLRGVWGICSALAGGENLVCRSGTLGEGRGFWEDRVAFALDDDGWQAGFLMTIQSIIYEYSCRTSSDSSFFQVLNSMTIN